MSGLDKIKNQGFKDPTVGNWYRTAEATAIGDNQAHMQIYDTEGSVSIQQ